MENPNVPDKFKNMLKILRRLCVFNILRNIAKVLGSLSFEHFTIAHRQKRVDRIAGMYEQRPSIIKEV